MVWVEVRRDRRLEAAEVRRRREERVVRVEQLLDEEREPTPLDSARIDALLSDELDAIVVQQVARVALQALERVNEDVVAADLDTDDVRVRDLVLLDAAEDLDAGLEKENLWIRLEELELVEKSVGVLVEDGSDELEVVADDLPELLVLVKKSFGNVEQCVELLARVNALRDFERKGLVALWT